MTIKRICIFICCLFLTMAVMAQKKEMAQARTYLKSGKDFDKAELLMTTLLAKDSVNRQNKKIYDIWYETVRMQYEAANEKLYLKQKYDTAQFFGLVHRMFQVAETLDSLDARPDTKGRVRPDYRERHAAYLDQVRRNLYFGGAYQVRKSRYNEAFGFFSAYIDAARQPLFTGYEYEQNDTLMPSAAYWATYCAYRLEHADSVLRYHHLALRDSSRREYTLQYVSEAYLRLHNDTAYVNMLRIGFDSNPEHPYFFPRLADYYTAAGRSDCVLQLADRGLAVNGQNQIFLLGKSLALLSLERYDECVDTSERLIALNDTLPEPYFMIATVNLNKALELEQLKEPRKYRTELTKLYTQARPYMEAYRKLAPDRVQRWAPALYRIYLNLNMGKQFEEIDRVLKKMK